VLAGLELDCVAYMDDIVVHGKDADQHDQRLIKVLQRLKDAGLRLNPAKCEFAKSRLEYLGHTISADGIAPSKSKTEAMLSLAPPANVKQLRSFLGATSYYRDFIPRYADLARPLNDLLSKDATYVWGQPQQKAFEALRECLANPPVLQYARQDRPFLVRTDASNVGIGAVLLQRADNNRLHPV
jgi:hypothetical protein